MRATLETVAVAPGCGASTFKLETMASSWCIPMALMPLLNEEKSKLIDQPKKIKPNKSKMI